ncbi:MAG: dihydrolipoamide acetyltransferase family protein [Acidobacteriota bacterium]
MAYEFRLPDIGEGVVEGEIVHWLVKAGDAVAEDEPMVEIMTDKATVEIPSPVKGVVLETRGAEGETVAVGSTLVVIEAEGAVPAESGGRDREAAAPTRSGGETRRPAVEKASSEILATPAVRRAARARGLDLQQIAGTGPGGRVTQEDLDRQVGGEPGPAMPTPPAAAPPGATETIPYRGLRRRIGDRLTLSSRTAVHYTYIEEVDATQLVELRNRYLEADSSRRLTYLPFILKAVVSGLKEYPLVNSTLDEGKGEIRLLKYYNIGIATATPDGLIVPIVRDVDSKRLLPLAEEIQALTEAAKKGRVSLDNLKGGTFTVTSLGPLGGIAATPVINYPEVAILAIHKIAKKPVVRDGEVVIRETMNLSLSLDHRIVDGMVAAQFLHHVIRLLETPGLLLLE